MKCEPKSAESATDRRSAVERLVMQCRLLECDHDPDGWPAIRMGDVSELCNEIDRLDVFKFDLGQDVIVNLSGLSVAGKIVSRCQTHTGGNNYAVYGKYKHATQAEWFSEREIVAA